jgi:hypothetical protein
MAKLTHLDALTQGHALTLYNSLLLHDGQHGDAARAAIAHAWFAEHRNILRYLLPYTHFRLLDRAHEHYREFGTVPTAQTAASYITQCTSLTSLTMLLHCYANIADTLPLLDLAGVRAALGDIISALTRTPDSPHCPVRRSADGAMLDSQYGPVLFGTPTERILLLTLYSVDGGGDLGVSRIHDMLGGSLTALQIAVRALNQKGVVQRYWTPGWGPAVRLVPVYSARAADERAKYSYSLTPAFAEEQRWRRRQEERRAQEAALFNAAAERRRGPRNGGEALVPLVVMKKGAKG